MNKKVYIFEDASSGELHAFKDYYSVLVYMLKSYIDSGALRDTIHSAGGNTQNIIEDVTQDLKSIVKDNYLEEVFYSHELEIEDADD